MLKLILNFVILTVLIAVAGLILELFIGGTGVLVILFSPAIAGFGLWSEGHKNRSETASERKRLINSVDRHKSTLSRNIERSVKKNDYGALIADNRNEALEEFFASIDLNMDAMNFGDAADIVFEQLEILETEARAAGFDAKNLPVDGYAFEKWVAEALIGFGWTANVTSGGETKGLMLSRKRTGKSLAYNASSIALR